MDFDYIIIGSGSSGSVMAARLSEREDLKVLLLEAGGRDTSLLLRMPLAFRLLRAKMLFDWGLASEPEPFANGRSIPAARGRVLGGSSSVNGMMYSRGHPRDYDQWAQMGAEGWSFDDVLPYFKRSENNWRGASQWHGAGGALSVSPMSHDDALVRALEATARGLGHPVTDDFEGDMTEGFGLPDLTTHKGVGRARRRLSCVRLAVARTWWSRLRPASSASSSRTAGPSVCAIGAAARFWRRDARGKSSPAAAPTPRRNS